jgi:DNA-directed RNA polymerase subunit RPC12/RpoP
MELWLRVLLIGIGIFVIVVGVIIGSILDKDAGAYECPECHERFVPEMKEYMMSRHTITTRRLHCPKCGATKYCKHVLTK